MASARRRSTSTVIERLFDDPRRFDFFQAVRVLERRAAIQGRDKRFKVRRPVGGDFAPSVEIARFRVAPHLTFPGNPVIEAQEGAGDAPPLLTTTFLGLVGPMGVLPQHYSELVVSQNRKRSGSLAAFLDLIHHRAISLFHRSWVKYRMPMAFERADLEEDVRRDDGGYGNRALERGRDQAPTTAILAALTGLGTGSMRGRLPFSDHLAWHFAGMFSATQKPVAALETLLGAVIRRPVKVESFVGSWLPIAEDEQTRLPSPRLPEGAYCRLGHDTVLGPRAWDSQGLFRVLVGPLDYHTFLDFMPDGVEMARMASLIRLYVGAEYDADVQVTLGAAAVPEIRLPVGEPERGAPRLGWNTWMVTGSSPIDRSAAVFRVGGMSGDLFHELIDPDQTARLTTQRMTTTPGE